VLLGGTRRKRKEKNGSDDDQKKVSGTLAVTTECVNASELSSAAAAGVVNEEGNIFSARARTA